MTDETCKTCRWFRPRELPKAAYGHGVEPHCRRLAPQAGQMYVALFPTVHESTEACGQWETVGPQHSSDCGTKYRGCAPECAFAKADKLRDRLEEIKAAERKALTPQPCRHEFSDDTHCELCGVEMGSKEEDECPKAAGTDGKHCWDTDDNGYRCSMCGMLDGHLDENAICLRRDVLKRGKYSSWAAKLTTDQMHALLWLLGEHFVRTHNMAEVDFGEMVSVGDRRRYAGYEGVLRFYRKPFGVREALQHIGFAVRKYEGKDDG